MLLSAEPNYFSFWSLCQNSPTASIARSNEERRASVLCLLSWHQSSAEKEEEWQRRTLVKHRKTRNSEWGKTCRTAWQRNKSGKNDRHHGKVQMFWQRTWEKATEKGHRRVLGAEGTRADVSNEEVMVAEAEILLKPALLHNCKLNQEPQLSLLLSHKTKSTLYLF